tara:strand:+ start:951 stop:2189 length:1239 start_codon:yes stop_codon:yes gene_type:complete
VNNLTNYQYVFLVGGRGSRLKELTKNIPKPLLLIDKKPFIFYQIQYLYKMGIRNFLFLAGYKHESFNIYIKEFREYFPNAKFNISIEDEPLGTAGAIKNSKDYLEDNFIVSNGDTFCNFSLIKFIDLEINKILLLDYEDDVSRFGKVKIDTNTKKIISFHEKNDQVKSNLINSGIYFLQKDFILKYIPEGIDCSLETEVFPKLCEEGHIRYQIQKTKFIDIGIPEDLEKFKRNLKEFIKTRGIILDRDGVINVDKGYTYKIEDLKFIDGIFELMNYFKSNEYPLFIATNQSGIARGLYSEKDFLNFMNEIKRVLRERDIDILDIEYCPYHPEAVLKKYRSNSELRKPRPGMLNNLVDKWNLDKNQTIYIGDKKIDLEAAKNAGINSFTFNKKNIFESFLNEKLPTGSSSVDN